MQPNGKYARWSDVVDDFTHFNHERAAIVEVCRTNDCGELEAEAKVKRAEEPFERAKRWVECLNDLRALGKYKAAKMAKEHDLAGAA